MIKPLFNHCLIEVIDDYEGVIRNNQDENVQKGVLRNFSVSRDHLTTSTGYEVQGLIDYAHLLKDMVGKVVYWQEYADTGSKFSIDGTLYVLVPFYRLIGFDDETTKKGDKE
jgi:hypothetical protein